METFDEMQKSWLIGKNQNAVALDNEYVKQIVTPRIKKERSRIFGYFWTSYFWQLTIYAALSHLLIRFWGDWQIVGIALAGIVLYIPFTAVFIKKYSRMAMQKNSSSPESMYGNLQTQHKLLTGFFQFKKRFDWIGIPVTCLVLVAIVFQLWVPNGWLQNITAAIVTYVCALIALIVATVSENRKSFIKPIKELQLLMDDLKQEVQ